MVLRRVWAIKKNHCATIKDCSMTARAVVLIDSTSKAVVVIPNHSSMASATVARAVVVIKNHSVKARVVVGIKF